MPVWSSLLAMRPWWLITLLSIRLRGRRRHPVYPLENLWVDSLDLARIALPRLKSHRLIDLVKAFDAPLSTHRADADVEALCAV
ncbi:MAG: hypothetical protein ACLT98_07245 [Eggerthellaceae bacterium]